MPHGIVQDNKWPSSLQQRTDEQETADIHPEVHHNASPAGPNLFSRHWFLNGYEWQPSSCETSEFRFDGGSYVLLHHTLPRSEEHTSELQSRGHLVCRLLLEQKKEYDHV